MDAFMIMPFNTEFNNVYTAVMAAIEIVRSRATKELEHPRYRDLANLNLHRLDDGFGAVPLMTDLLRRLKTAHLCIVDISGNNPNVNWELGFATALEKPIITILDPSSGRPNFDVSGYRYLEYDAKNLEASLTDKLVEEIFGLFQVVPEATAYPDKLGFARALAMSTAAPAYFLDSDFKIVYMNESASAIFFAADAGSASSCINDSLNSFLNRISDRLVNLVQIERNLQEQKEQLRMAAPGAAKPINIETVVLETGEYGEVEMQKIGIAVRNPSDGTIQGWVVSFNVVRPKNPEKFNEFYSIHRRVLEINMGLNSGKAAPSKGSGLPVVFPTWGLPPNTNTDLKWASNYSEKQECFEYMVQVMLSDEKRYGLQSVKYLDNFFFDYLRTEYLMLQSAGRLVGLLRLHVDHPVDSYADLDFGEWSFKGDDAKELGAFADAGVYFPKDCPTEERIKHLAKMLGFSSDRLEQSHQVINIYAQIPSKLLEFYEEFGFSKIGNPFKCKGWRGTWMPIWVNNWEFRYKDTERARLFKQIFESSRPGSGGPAI